MNDVLGIPWTYINTGVPSKADPTRTMFVDQDGMAWDLAPNFSDGIRERVVGDGGTPGTVVLEWSDEPGITHQVAVERVPYLTTVVVGLQSLDRSQLLPEVQATLAMIGA